MKRFFVGIIVISAFVVSAALARSGDDESNDVEIVLSDMPLAAIVNAARQVH